MIENKSIRIEVPEQAQLVLETLKRAGHEAYVVGGCVRDSILGRTPQDWDVTTSAKPEEVKALFRRTIDTGIKHGTVTVMMGEEGYEVTTYRIDGAYEDGRHPKEVTFTPSLEEDLKRRDFTINAMAYNDEDGLADLFGGLEDMEKRLIRCVGDAKERFGEDALRILRAVRFSAQLGYEIEEDTRQGIIALAENLRQISAERIQAELVKLLVSPHPERMRVAYETGITKVILPEFDLCMETPQNHKHHCYNVGEHLLVATQMVAPRKDLRLAAFLHDIGKPAMLTVDEEGITHFYGHPEVSAEMSLEILRRLKFDNDTIQKVCTLVRYHEACNGTDPDPRLVRRTINRVGEEAFPDLFEICYGDICAQSNYMRQEKLDLLQKWRELYEDVLARKECISLKTLAIGGKDLIAAGVAPGPRMGSLLQELLEEVLEDPSRNTREYLLDRAMSIR